MFVICDKNSLYSVHYRRLSSFLKVPISGSYSKYLLNTLTIYRNAQSTEQLDTEKFVREMYMKWRKREAVVSLQVQVDGKWLNDGEESSRTVE